MCWGRRLHLQVRRVVWSRSVGADAEAVYRSVEWSPHTCNWTPTNGAEAFKQQSAKKKLTHFEGKLESVRELHEIRPSVATAASRQLLENKLNSIRGEHHEIGDCGASTHRPYSLTQLAEGVLTLWVSAYGGGLQEPTVKQVETYVKARMRTNEPGTRYYVDVLNKARKIQNERDNCANVELLPEYIQALRDLGYDAESVYGNWAPGR